VFIELTHREKRVLPREREAKGHKPAPKAVANTKGWRRRYGW
jgi:hypothetical protein